MHWDLGPNSRSVFPRVNHLGSSTIDFISMCVEGVVCVLERYRDSKADGNSFTTGKRERKPLSHFM